MSNPYLVPGATVVNLHRGREDRPSTVTPDWYSRGDEIGVVVDRPEMPLPMFAGLAVWVRYVDRMDFMQLTLASDLKALMYPEPWKPAAYSFGPAFSDPDKPWNGYS